MDKQKAEAMDVPEESRETEKSENDSDVTEAMDLPEESHATETNETDSDRLKQSESTEQSPETLTTELEMTSNTSSADDSSDSSDDASDDWDDGYYNTENLADYLDGDDIYKRCLDEDKMHPEPTDKEMEQDSVIQEAVSPAPENIAQSSQVQSSSENYKDAVEFKKSQLESISEEPELVMLPAKKGSKATQLRNPKKMSKEQFKMNQRHQILLASKETVLKTQRPTTFEDFSQIEEITKMLPQLMRRNTLPAELPRASGRITDFPPMRITERDKPYFREMGNWLSKPKPKTEPLPPVPPPAALPKIHKAANIYQILMEVKAVPVQSIGESSIVQPLKENSRLAPASSKEEITAPVGSEVSEKLELSPVLPPKKNPKFTSPVPVVQETAPVKPIVKISEELEELSLVPPQNEDITHVSSASTEENTLQLIAKDAPKKVTDLAVQGKQTEDPHNTPNQTNGEPSQQNEEAAVDNFCNVLLFTALECIATHQATSDQSISEVSKDERILPTSSVTSDPSVQEDEKTAREMLSSRLYEEFETAPQVSPRTKFHESWLQKQRKCKIVKLDADFMQLGEATRKIQLNDEIKTDRPNEAQSNSAEQVPPVPRSRRVSEPISPLSPEKNDSKAEFVLEAPKQVGHAPLPSSRAENGSHISLVPVEKLTAQDNTITEQRTRITDFPPIRFTERDLPYINYVFCVKRSQKPGQKPAKKARRPPPALLKLRDNADTLQVPTKKVEQVKPASKASKEPAQAPSISVSSGKADCSLSTSVLKLKDHAGTLQIPAKKAERVEPVSEPSKEPELVPPISVSSGKAECSPTTVGNTVLMSPTLSKSTLETAHLQLVPEESEHLSSDLTPRSAEDECPSHQISDEECENDQSAELILSETETLQSDEVTISEPIPNVALFDEVPLQQACSSKVVPFSSSLPFIARANESLSFAHITHNDFLQELAQKKIRIFRAYRENLPNEAHIRDLIGVQVYQWTSCTQKKQPCDMFCSYCNFCCHQFYCTCRPYKLRAVSWCMHIHAATHASENEREFVVFVMDTWQMSQPELAHLRALCYEPDNIATSSKNDFFVVKEFGFLKTKVTPGNLKRRCGNCLPKYSCSSCNICRHVYQCGCPTYRQGELCEHCHVVALYQTQIQEIGESCTQSLGSSGISKETSNSNGTSELVLGSDETTQAEDSDRTSKMALDSDETNISGFDTESGGRSSEKSNDRDKREQLE